MSFDSAMRRATSAEFVPVEASAPTLQQILVALSFALDLTEGAVPGHAVRCCLLGARMALAAGLDDVSVADLYYASLLKDVGCSSNSARMCQIVGGDDRVVKAGAKLADWRQPFKPQPQAVRMLWRNVLPGAPAWRRALRLLRIASDQPTNNRELIELRCDRGAKIVGKLGLSRQVALAVRHLDEHWDGGGYPSHLRGKEIPMLSRIMGVAQHLDAFCMERGPQAALSTLEERSGRWFDPELVRIAGVLHRSQSLFTNCLPNDPVEEARAVSLTHHPDDGSMLSAMDIDTICETFADVVDAKSPFTYRHSLGVRDAAVGIGEVLGLSYERMQVVRRAALLHDIGKLGISNSILDKPTRLTDDEIQLMQAHPRLGTEILRPIAAFGEIALLAGEHHEKLDGSGYPYKLDAAALSLESRLLAVADIFGALSEQRPYRDALAPEQIRAIMRRDVPERLDPVCYEALESVMERLCSVPATPQETVDERWLIGFDAIEAFI